MATSRFLDGEGHMPSPLLVAATDCVPELASAIGIAFVLNALASVLRVWIKQSARTRRLNIALENSEPSQRPGIIMACSRLEGVSAGELGNDSTGETSTTEVAVAPPAQITRTRHGHERNGG